MTQPIIINSKIRTKPLPSPSHSVKRPAAAPSIAKPTTPASRTILYTPTLCAYALPCTSQEKNARPSEEPAHRAKRKPGNLLRKRRLTHHGHNRCPDGKPKGEGQTFLFNVALRRPPPRFPRRQIVMEPLPTSQPKRPLFVTRIRIPNSSTAAAVVFQAQSNLAPLHSLIPFETIIPNLGLTLPKRHQKKKTFSRHFCRFVHARINIVFLHSLASRATVSSLKLLRPRPSTSPSLSKKEIFRACTFQRELLYLSYQQAQVLASISAQFAARLLSRLSRAHMST